MNINDLLKNINDQKEQLDVLLTLLTDEYLKDKNIPVNDRWEVYSTVVDRNILKNNEIYGDGHIDILSSDREITLYDDFYIEKYQTESFTSMYAKIPELDDDLDQDVIDEWREAVLQSGYTSFTYDW